MQCVRSGVGYKYVDGDAVSGARAVCSVQCRVQCAGGGQCAARGATRACDGPFQFTGHEQSTREPTYLLSSIIESTGVGESTWRNKIIHICTVVNLACCNNKLLRFPLLFTNINSFLIRSKGPYKALWIIYNVDYSSITVAI